MIRINLAPVETRRRRGPGFTMPALPIGLGLGVRSGEQAATVAGFADGVIVGSALVSAAGKGEKQLRELTEELAAGVRRPATQPA